MLGKNLGGEMTKISYEQLVKKASKRPSVKVAYDSLEEEISRFVSNSKIGDLPNPDHEKLFHLEKYYESLEKLEKELDKKFKVLDDKLKYIEWLMNKGYYGIIMLTFSFIDNIENFFEVINLISDLVEIKK